jgi:hypothetical protein
MRGFKNAAQRCPTGRYESPCLGFPSPRSGLLLAEGLYSEHEHEHGDGNDRLAETQGGTLISVT